MHSDLPKIRELLTAGSDINKLSYVAWEQYDCGTPLHFAIRCNQPAALELPIIRGADLNLLDEGSHDRHQDTTIPLAVRLGRWDMFKRLWDAGAERNKYPPKQRSARCSLVEVAASEGHAGKLGDLLSWNQSWTGEERTQA
ncbi:hypothetical protein BU23DRAFT_639455 [Bimuria novae-zelandiae CBS 107.79]|uniref:Uncharacterized protein n=1 Tax=Bimuria novae-zelandiae CBS 107.79 TaxID=1447943 RepID=A0A6A5V983_9PLEO|nr:hypothetical protein BU23DRAFT_639455 [Bimuria novae-zelandiae CBS 107.79]